MVTCGLLHTTNSEWGRLYLEQLAIFYETTPHYSARGASERFVYVIAVCL